MISFQCDECDRPYQAPDGSAGRSLHCKGCGTKLTVPEPKPSQKQRSPKKRKSQSRRPAAENPEAFDWDSFVDKSKSKKAQQEPWEDISSDELEDYSSALKLPPLQKRTVSETPVASPKRKKRKKRKKTASYSEAPGGEVLLALFFAIGSLAFAMYELHEGKEKHRSYGSISVKLNDFEKAPIQICLLAATIYVAAYFSWRVRVHAFQESLAKGAICWLIPIYMFFYTRNHWEEGRPFFFGWLVCAGVSSLFFLAGYTTDSSAASNSAIIFSTNRSGINSISSADELESLDGDFRYVIRNGRKVPILNNQPRAIDIFDEAHNEIHQQKPSLQFPNTANASPKSLIPNNPQPISPTQPVVVFQLLGYQSAVDAAATARSALTEIPWVNRDIVVVNSAQKELILGVRGTSVNTLQAKIALERAGFQIGRVQYLSKGKPGLAAMMVKNINGSNGSSFNNTKPGNLNEQKTNPLKNIPQHNKPTSLPVGQPGGLKFSIMAPSPRTTLATVGVNNSVKLWSTKTGKSNRGFNHTADIRCLAFASNGREVAYGTSDGLIRFYNISERKHTKRVKGLDGEVTAISFPSSSDAFLAGTNKGQLLFWKSANELVPQVIGQVEESIVNIIPFDGKTIFIVGRSGSISVLGIGEGSLKPAFQVEGGAINSVVLSPDKQVLAFATSDNGAQLHDPNSGEKLGQIDEGNITAVAFSNSNGKIAVGGERGKIIIWNWPACTPQSRLAGFNRTIASINFSEDDLNVAASAQGDERIYSWDLTKPANSGKENRFSPNSSGIPIPKFPPRFPFPKQGTRSNKSPNF